MALSLPHTCTSMCVSPCYSHAQVHQQNQALQSEVDELLAELAHISTSAQATSASLHKVCDVVNVANVCVSGPAMCTCDAVVPSCIALQISQLDLSEATS